MAKFKAYGFNLTENDEKIISKMFSLVTTDMPEIYDLRSFSPEIDSDDVIFVYGLKSKKICKELKCLAKIEFPDIAKLDATTGDEGQRELAYKEILKLKKYLGSNYKNEEISTGIILEDIKDKINETSLPPLNSKQVMQLEIVLKKKGITSWVCKSKDGIKTRITIEPEKSDADINLTFKELYALKACMEVLHIEEFEIAYKYDPNSS